MIHLDFAHEFLILGSFRSKKAVATKVPACQSQDLSERRTCRWGDVHVKELESA